MRFVPASCSAQSPWAFLRWSLGLLLLIAGARTLHAAAPGMHHASSGGELFLGGNGIELGLRANGAFGTATNKPAGFTGTEQRSKIGMVTDLDGFEVGTVEAFDFFMPGEPFVGWGAGYKIAGTPTTGQNKNGTTPVTQIPVDSLTDNSSGSTASATCVATLGTRLEITQQYSLGVNDRYFTIHVTLKNVGAASMTNVRYQFGVDPDNTVDLGGEYFTINTLLHTHLAGDGKAVIEAESIGTTTLANLFLYCTHPGAVVSTGYDRNVDVYNSAYYEFAQAKDYMEVDDTTLFMTVEVGSLSAGASASFDLIIGLSRDSLAQLESQMAGGHPPEITSGSSASGPLNAAFLYQITATHSPTSYELLAGTLPSGLSFNSSTGRITGTPTQDGLFDLIIAASNAAGSGSAPLTLTIGITEQTVSFAPVSGLAIGIPCTVSATASSGLPVGYSITSGNASFSGAVLAVNDANPVVIRATQAGDGTYSSAYAELTVQAARQAQAIIFAPITDKDRSEGSFILGVSASSGLPVTLTVTSGPATLSETTLTLTGEGGDVTVTATQTGNAAYYPAASVSRSFHVTKKHFQSINFPALVDRLSTTAPFIPGATASSGLPVSFTLLSGPAMLSEGIVTLTGAPGTVTLRASQAGNADYAPAADVTRSFAVRLVGPRVFFGLVNGKDPLAGVLTQDGLKGSLIGYLSATSEGFVVHLTLEKDGGYSGVATTFVGTNPGSSDTLRIATTSLKRSFHCRLEGLTLSGSIAELGLDFSAAQDAPLGPTADIAGYYTMLSLSTVSGDVHSVIGTQGRQYVLAVTPSLVASATIPISGSGGFSALLSQGVTYAGKVNADDTTEAGTLAQTGQMTLSLLGLNYYTTRTDRLINLSARTLVDDAVPANGTLISGFVITGNEPKRVMLRGVGPSLRTMGVRNTLSDPRIKLYSIEGTLLAQNDDWGNDPALAATAQRIGAFALTPGSKDAVLMQTLNPGVYTMSVSDSGGSGVALGEIYDASENPQANYQRLVNISARGLVSSGEGVLIAGFVVTGNAPKRVLIRGIGPGLARFGLGGVLADPLLTIHDSRLKVVVKSDNWGQTIPGDLTGATSTAAEIRSAAGNTGAFALEPGSRDASLIIALAPGAYTAMVTAPAGTSGVALVEVYELP